MHKNILMIEKIIDHYIVFMCFINCVDFKHLKKNYNWYICQSKQQSKNTPSHLLSNLWCEK